MQLSYTKAVDKVLALLPGNYKKVLEMRYGLAKYPSPYKLQEIGDKMGITRERVRQIQKNAIEKLSKDKCFSGLSSSFQKLEQAFSTCNGIATHGHVCSIIKTKTKKDEKYIHLLLDAGKQFHEVKENEDHFNFFTTQHSHAKNLSQMIGQLHTMIDAQKDKILTQNEMYKLITENFKKNNVAVSSDIVLSLSKKIKKSHFNEWGHADHNEITLGNVGDYMRVILRHAKAPMHYSDLAKQVQKYSNKKIKIQTCLNELIRNKTFVLVGRGKYALSSDGYRPGTTKEILTLILKEKGLLTRKQIIKEISKERDLKEGTIKQILIRDKTFHFLNGKYALRG